MTPTGRFVGRWQVSGTPGAVVAVDVLRAFTTAAYAFGAGASRILLVDSVADALALKAQHAGALAIGEDGGRMPDGFDLPNSPVEVAGADVVGRTLIQRTSAGTRGVVAARSATRLWCASLVCASATARAVAASGLGEPTYLITGRFEDQPDRPGHDDLVTAELIERARLGQDLDAARTARAVAESDEAALTLALGHGHVHPEDIEYAVQVDRFGFAMEVRRTAGLLELRRTAGAAG
ncbi:MAG TPA: 2-phosphosulfolactate phosphatase [Jiangellaceae bacterium]